MPDPTPPFFLLYFILTSTCKFLLDKTLIFQKKKEEKPQNSSLENLLWSEAPFSQDSHQSGSPGYSPIPIFFINFSHRTERRWNVQSRRSLQCPKTVTFPSNEWPWRTIPLVYHGPKDFQLPVPTLSHEEQNPSLYETSISQKADLRFSLEGATKYKLWNYERWKVWNSEGQLWWGFLIPCAQLLPLCPAQLHPHPHLGTTLSLESRLGQSLPLVQTFCLLIGKLSPNLFVCSWRENIP